MPDNLREAVARKLAEIEYGEGHDEPWEPFLLHAGEVVAMILEGAAKVADKHAADNWGFTEEEAAAQDIANAIRLLGKDGG